MSQPDFRDPTSRSHEGNSFLAQDDGFEMEPSQYSNQEGAEPSPANHNMARKNATMANSGQFDPARGLVDAHHSRLYHPSYDQRDGKANAGSSLEVNTFEPGKHQTFDPKPKLLHNFNQDDAKVLSSMRQNSNEQTRMFAEATLGAGENPLSFPISCIGSDRAISVPISTGALSAGRFIGDGTRELYDKRSTAHHNQKTVNQALDEQVKSSEFEEHKKSETSSFRQLSDVKEEAPHRFILKKQQPDSQSSGGLNNDKDLIERSAASASLPLQSSASKGTAGPSPLIRQLSEKVRSQAERLSGLENYKQLCEQLILTFDPEHPMPVVEEHLAAAAQLGDHPAAELRHMLVQREQDLQLSKQRIDSLSKEVEELKSSNQQENFQALRKEIELNEKLMQENEQLKLDLAKSPQGKQSQHSSRPGSAIERGSSKPQLSARSSTPVDDSQMKALQSQVDQLNNEKNALLDYIDENLDKFRGLSAMKKSRESFDGLSNTERLKNELTDLQEQILKLNKENTDLTARNEALIKQQYQSPSFPSQQENTFGDASQLKKQFLETKERFGREKDEFQLQIQRLQERLLEQEAELDREKHANNKLNQALLSKMEDGPHSRSAQSQRSSGRISKERELEEQVSQLKRELSSAIDALKKREQEIQFMDGDLQSNLKLLNFQKDTEIPTLRQHQEEAEAKISTLEADLAEAKQSLEKEAEKAKQFEQHIKDLKQQEGSRIDSITNRWEETVTDLSRELQNAKQEMMERQQMFNKLEDELRQKMSQADFKKEEQTRLQERIEDLNAEVKMLATQKNEKDTKLKTQIRKNEELLGELQELSEAVNVLKNNKEMTLNSHAMEEREQVIEEYSRFITNKQKRSTDRILATILKIVERIRDFSQVQNLMVQTHGRSQQIFDEIDEHLKSIANQQRNSKSSSQTDLLIKAQEDIKANANIFKDLEHLTKSLCDWNECLMEHVRSRVSLLNDTQKQLLDETSQNQELAKQLSRLQSESNDLNKKDETMENDLRDAQLTMFQKEQQMKDVYKREEKLQRQNQKIKVQLDQLVKEQEKLVAQLKTQLQTKQQLTLEVDTARIETEKAEARVKILEQQIGSNAKQITNLTDLVENLKLAMPSPELKSLVTDLQAVTQKQFTVTEEYAEKENSLTYMENQLRQFAKNDTGLSQKVISLRKEISKYRDVLKSLQIERSNLSQASDSLVGQLKNCETSEKRRHDVALETEKALTEAKDKIKEQQKEIIFVNNNRKDLETAVSGLQEYNGMLQRELTTLRTQLKNGTYDAAQAAARGLDLMNTSAAAFQNQTPTLGSTLAKVKTARPDCSSRQASLRQQIANQNDGSRTLPILGTQESNTAVQSSQRFNPPQVILHQAESQQSELNYNGSLAKTLYNGTSEGFPNLEHQTFRGNETEERLSTGKADYLLGRGASEQVSSKAIDYQYSSQNQPPESQRREVHEGVHGQLPPEILNESSEKRRWQSEYHREELERRPPIPDNYNRPPSMHPNDGSVRDPSYDHGRQTFKQRSMSLGGGIGSDDKYFGDGRDQGQALFQNEFSRISASHQRTMQEPQGYSRGASENKDFKRPPLPQHPLGLPPHPHQMQSMNNSRALNAAEHYSDSGVHPSRNMQEVPVPNNYTQYPREAALTSFDKNQRVALSENHSRPINSARDSPSQDRFEFPRQMPPQVPLQDRGLQSSYGQQKEASIKHSSQARMSHSSNHDYGTFGGRMMAHHTHNNPTLGVAEQFGRMTPSRGPPAHSSVAAGGRNSGPSTLDLITLQGQPSSQRSIFASGMPGSHAASGQAHSSMAQVQMAQGPSFQPSKPETEEDHDSFNSDRLQPLQPDLHENKKAETQEDLYFHTGQGDLKLNTASGSVIPQEELLVSNADSLMRSEMLVTKPDKPEGGDDGGTTGLSTGARPLSALRQNLTQVKNVFAAIRQNLVSEECSESK